MDQTGYLGIDVSKGYSDFILLNSSKEILGKGYKLYDNRQGHDTLFKRLAAAKEKYELTAIICGVESTGGYENNWYNSLDVQGSNLGIKIVRLNPKGVKHQGESKGNRTVTDQVSARTIAYQLIENETKILSHSSPDLQQSQARRYYHYINTLQRQKTALNNQLEKLVYSSFPELLVYAKNGMPAWLIKLLTKYPDHESVSKSKKSNLLKINGLTAEKIERIKKLAKESVGQPSDILLAKTVSSLSKQIVELTIKIKEEKAYLSANYTSAQVALLEGIKGIGLYTAIGIMMEIENINRFANSSAMSSYFGVHPVFKKSGDGQVKPRMSKQGSTSYRGIIYMAARNVVNHNDYFKEIYAKFRAKGMKDGQAIGVIMHKLTRVICGMLKSNKPFDPKVDKRNRDNTVEQQKKEQTPQEKEQIQQEVEMIKNAPCSNRAFKKKKAELEPQTPLERSKHEVFNSTSTNI